MFRIRALRVTDCRMNVNVSYDYSFKPTSRQMTGPECHKTIEKVKTSSPFFEKNMFIIDE